MDHLLSSPRDDDEILRAFEAASAVRLAGESDLMEEALVACTHLFHAGWSVLGVVRRDDEPAGWVGWVPVVGDHWASIVQLASGHHPEAIAAPVLCWLAHSGDGLRASGAASTLESLFTPWEDRLADACADEVRRRQWDPRAPAPTWTSRWDPTVRTGVRVLAWTAETLPHRCLRPRPPRPVRDEWSDIRPLASA
jgi:hypothetical protein